MKLHVRLGERGYPIWFGAEARTRLAKTRAEAEARGGRLAVITDSSVRAACSAIFRGELKGLPVHAVAPGEEAKSPAGLAGVWEFLADARLDRGGIVLAVGGGVVGDLAGFAAASYQRGVEFWQVPTTLLAMVDSSVGGKTGINLKAGKNLAGAFHQPRAVFVDPALLRSLPPREFAAGMAEVVKYGMLGDAALFRELEARPLARTDAARIARIVRRCCAIKARVVEADEFETAPSGGRALLNLGHTFGHAIERVAGYGTYLHGEAVSIGLVCAALLSEMLGLVPSGTSGRTSRTLAAHRLPVRLRASLPAEALVAAMGRDKKVRGGRPRFVTLTRIGKADTNDDVPPEAVTRVLAEIGAE